MENVSCCLTNQIFDHLDSLSRCVCLHYTREEGNRGGRRDGLERIPPGMRDALS